ncbi:MAG TPA: HEAT repeat domain-containing protein [Elusimicrobiota bacterium]|nr:HEAT repeat domain-containing protein [Elusimicrobiota bacterium]
MRKLLALAFLALAARPAAADDAPELEPLVVTAPRLKVKQPALMDPSINANLLRLLRDRADARPQPQDLLDASVGNLAKLSTVTGYKLKTRYTELGFLLTEGLAGTSDIALTSELERVARQGTNVQTRAAAMVALAYGKDPRYEPLFQQAMLDPEVTVRFGALESLQILGTPGARQLISLAANSDSSVLVRIYAAAAMWRAGDVYGRELLLRLYQDSDWLTRALATRYLGEMGGADEYRRLFQQLNTESNASVKSELVSALLRLQGRRS